MFVGKERVFNRRFLLMAAHYMFEPTACTPASGWEKGQVENQVKIIRDRFFKPRLHFKPGGAERLAGGGVRRRRQGASASRTGAIDRLAGLGGRAAGA